MEEEFIPVYLFLGFLESGKTRFIQSALSDDSFQANGRILVILCEEGFEEYEPLDYPDLDVEFVTIEDESQMTEEYLTELTEKYQPEQILVEYNGMWLVSKFYDAMPEKWGVYQTTMFADSTTILQYNANMRGLVADKIAQAEMILFNRYQLELKNAEELHRLVRGVNRRTQIFYEAEDGRTFQDDIEDPLPFDVEAPAFVVKDEDYALFFADLMEEPKKYKGKTVTFKAFAIKNTSFPKNAMAVGRHVMTCCADDVQFYWLELRYDGTIQSYNKAWVMVKAEIDLVKRGIKRETIPVLKALSVAPADPPETEIASFY